MKTIKLNNVEVTLTKEQLQQALEDFDKPKFDYPICCKSVRTGNVILYTDLKEGTLLTKGVYNTLKVGHYLDDCIPHTDGGMVEIPYDTERGFYHKQPVYCWDSEFTHEAVLRAYDALNKCTFTYDGYMNGGDYEHYSATVPEHMKVFKEK